MEQPQCVNFHGILSASPAFFEVFEIIKQLAFFPTTVLLTGESGTGKEMVAKAIHASSARRDKPFIAINCGAIPENLMESELFGHKKGAFTDAYRDKCGLFEEANGGTLFLDEIGEMPLRLQVKLLRAIQERTIRRVGSEMNIPVDVRIISATLRNLNQAVKLKAFREDLLYRLNVITLELPPLRNRREDIPFLAQHFITKHSKRFKIPEKRVAHAALQQMHTYDWPGNVRELENCIERGIIFSPGELIKSEVLPSYMRRRKHEVRVQLPILEPDESYSIRKHTAEIEVELIKKALTRTGNCRTSATKLLGISHRALLYKIRDYSLDTWSPGDDD